MSLVIVLLIVHVCMCVFHHVFPLFSMCMCVMYIIMFFVMMSDVCLYMYMLYHLQEGSTGNGT